MNAVEFTTELSGSDTLTIPQEIAAQLPKSGQARVIILTSEHNKETEWRLAAYEQFLREDPPEDSIYDSLR
jgi:transaldolase